MKSEDPSRVEVGQVWDFDSDGEYLLVIVVDTRDDDRPKHLALQARRNVSVYVVQDVLNDEPQGRFEGHVISYSENHLRRNFRRVS